MCWSVFRHDRYSIKVCCCVVDIGTKQQPMHVLVSHGSVGVACPPVPDLAALTDWLQHAPDGQLEGIVWHCPNGNLFKVCVQQTFPLVLGLDFLHNLQSLSDVKQSLSDVKQSLIGSQ